MGAASVIAVTQIVTLEHPDALLVAAVCVFAVAIPILFKLSFKPVPDNGKPGENLKPHLFYFAVLILDFLGFGLIFFHFGRVAGCAFVASALFAVWLLLRDAREAGRKP